MKKDSWTPEKGCFKRHAPGVLDILPLGNFEPNDYPDGDIGSATIKELHLQNGE